MASIKTIRGGNICYRQVGRQIGRQIRKTKNFYLIYKQQNIKKIRKYAKSLKQVFHTYTKNLNGQ